MILEKIRSSEAYESINKDLKNGRTSGTYIVWSADTTMRDSFMQAVSMLFMCPKQGCGTCPACKKIIANAHRDIKVIKYISKGAKDMMREDLVAHSLISPGEGMYKLYHIEDMDFFTPEVQNVMLKVTEEPPVNTLIFLYANNESGVIQTIKSRAKQLYLPRFSIDEIRDVLVDKGLAKEEAEMAAIMSDNRLDNAIQYTENPKSRELLDEVFSMLINCKKSGDAGKYVFNKLYTRENIKQTLEIIRLILNDVQTYVTGAKRPIVFSTKRKEIVTISIGHNAGSVALGILATVHGNEMIEFNVSVASIIEYVLLNILESKYYCSK